MSNPISSILNNYDYTKSLSGTQNTVSDKQNTYAQLLADILKLSDTGAQDSTGVQSNSLLSTGNVDTTTGASGLASLLSTGTSNSTGANSTLTADELKTYITNLLGQGLSSVSSDTTSSSNTSDTTLGNQVSGLDFTSSIENQIQSILDKNTSSSNDFQTQVQNSASSQQTNSEFPTNLQLSGAALPPFNWKPTTTA